MAQNGRFTFNINRISGYSYMSSTYFSGYIKQSLYYPFNSFDTKPMAEEMVDSIFSLIQNSIGLVLSFYMFTDIININRSVRSTKQVHHQSSISE